MSEFLFLVRKLRVFIWLKCRCRRSVLKARKKTGYFIHVNVITYKSLVGRFAVHVIVEIRRN